MDDGKDRIDRGHRAIHEMARTPEGQAFLEWLAWAEAVDYSPWRRDQSAEETHVRLGRQALAKDILRIAKEPKRHG